MTTTPNKYFIKNAVLVSDGRVWEDSILLEGGRINRIGSGPIPEDASLIDAEGLHLLPGVIDGQVHFRDPGLTHKADLYSESKAALAGGTTSFIDMPNTKPNVLNRQLLEEKYQLAAQKSLANFGFFLGVNGETIDEVLKTKTDDLLAVSDDGLYFSGAGNILADQPEALEKLFANCPALIAIHSELETTVVANEKKYREQYGEDVPVELHPIIRSEEACFEATKRAIALAKKHGARLHILHLTTAKEVSLFESELPLEKKKITTEASVHHLWFTDEDYQRLGKRIKWNPAIKTKEDRAGLLAGLKNGNIDLITTDHAPHLWEEKDQPYFQSMSGAPLVQHALSVMLEYYHSGDLSLELIVEKMAHNPAILYGLKDRGFIREGYWGDVILVDLNAPYEVNKSNLLYKCGWSPLEGTRLKSQVVQSFVNGHRVYCNGEFDEQFKGQALWRQS